MEWMIRGHSELSIPVAQPHIADFCNKICQKETNGTAAKWRYSITSRGVAKVDR
jgi:hypothetical protein